VASGPSVDIAIEILDAYIGCVTPSSIPLSVDCRLWTVAPAFDGTGGTEVTGGGYAPEVFTTTAATAGGAGVIAKIQNANFYFTNLPVASSSVVAATIHNHGTGQMIWLNDSWTSPGAWAVGGSPLIKAVDIVRIVPVSA
jgi:hypothetical protein